MDLGPRIGPFTAWRVAALDKGCIIQYMLPTLMGVKSSGQKRLISAVKRALGAQLFLDEWRVT